MARRPQPIVALVPPQDGDEPVTPEQVQRMLPQHDGKPMFSREWVIRTVAQDHKRKLGRHVFWPRRHVAAWLASWMAGEIHPSRRRSA